LNICLDFKIIKSHYTETKTKFNMKHIGLYNAAFHVESFHHWSDSCWSLWGQRPSCLCLAGNRYVADKRCVR